MLPKRLERLRNAMNERNIPALLVTSSFNRRYLTGFTGTSGFALITYDRAILFTDFRYTTQAAEQAPHFEIFEHQPKPLRSVAETLESLHIGELAFEQDDVSYGSFLQYSKDLGGAIRLVATAQLVENLRMIKDDEELRIMREAAVLADRTFSHILTFLKPGVSEREIAFEIEMFMRKNGAASSSFDTIVASGERSALPHGVAGERVLQAEEFVKLDFGAFYQGYCSDITRTVYLGGKPSDRHKEIYEIVLKAQMTALERIKPGMTGKEADAIARDVIAEYGYGEKFGHGTGHGLGMQIHEAPRLSPLGDIVLHPGMTVTVEPGIYIPGFGGVRIEDDVVVTDNGVSRLTMSDKQFICIAV